MTRTILIASMLAMLSACPPALRGTASQVTPEAEPEVADVRQAAGDAFLGLYNLDDKGDIDLSGHLYEDEVLAPCRSVPWIKEQAEELFRAAKFRPAGPLMPFPQHGGVVVRPAGSAVDGEGDQAVFYFSLSKSTTECVYHLGLLARRKKFVDGRGFVQVSPGESTDLVEEVRVLLKQWGAHIKATSARARCPTPSTGPQEVAAVRAFLDAHASADRVIKMTVEGVQQRLPEMLASLRLSTSNVRLIVYDARNAPPAVAAQLGSTCAVLDGAAPVLACSDELMAFSEAAFRVYMLTDGNAFASHKLIAIAQGASHDPYRALGKMRDRMSSDPMANGYVLGMMMSGLTYYAAHELAHLARCDFGAALDQQAVPVDARSAALKMCRHLDEFGSIGLSDKATFVEADLGAREFNRLVDREVVLAEEILRHRFENERRADDNAVGAMLDIMSRLGRESVENGRYEELMTARAVFAVGMLSWAQLIGDFGARYCPAWAKSNFVDAPSLETCLGKTEARIAGAGLFGSVHPFLFLRAHRILTATVGERLFPRRQLASWRMSEAALAAAPESDRRLVRWRQEAMLLYHYASILMDNPFKVAALGCTARFDERLAGVTFIKNFYSIEESHRILLDRSEAAKIDVEHTVRSMKDDVP